MYFDLTADDRLSLDHAGALRRFPAGDSIIHDGDRSDYVVVIRTGYVKVVASASADGDARILAFRGPGELVGELAGLGRTPRHGSVLAVDPVEALMVSGPRFARLLNERQGISSALARSVSARLAEADRYRHVAGTAGVTGALAEQLLDLAERFGTPADDGGLVLGMPLTHQDLADCVGVSYRTVARAFAIWRKDGLVTTRRRRIVVQDPVGLRAWTRAAP